MQLLRIGKTGILIACLGCQSSVTDHGADANSTNPAISLAPSETNTATLPVTETRSAVNNTSKSTAEPPGNADELKAMPETQSLMSLSWNDIPSAMSQVKIDPESVESLLSQAESSDNPALRFILGWTLFARGDLVTADDWFRRIPVEEIPASFIYVPYRTHEIVRIAPTNHYEPAMVRFLEAKQLPALTAARVHVRRGQLREGIESYLKTDPANWVNVDVENFRLLLAHSGLAGEVRTVLAAAVKAGRVPESIQQPLADAAVATVIPRSEAEIEAAKTRLRDQLENNDRLRSEVTASVKKQLEERVMFAERRFEELTARHRNSDAMMASDESTLLMVMSGAALNDVDVFQIWSQELKRRFPDPEVSTWIISLADAME